jgi:hypothetical protein
MAFRKKVSILGIVIGSIVDIVGTNIWGIFITIYVFISYNLLPMAISSPTEAIANVLYIIKTDPIVVIVNIIVGSLFSILGGYISANIAKHNELLNGALASFLCILTSICSILMGSYSTSLFLDILLLTISPLLSMFGGYLRLKQKTRRNVKVPA